jgi:hypothetical protein
MNSSNTPHDSSTPSPHDGVERLLASFVPRPSRLDRDRLMYLAGQAAITSAESSRSMTRYWQVATFLSTTCAAVLAGVLLTRSIDNSVRGSQEASQFAESLSRSPSSPKSPASALSTDSPAVETLPQSQIGLPAIVVSPNSVLHRRVTAMQNEFKDEVVGNEAYGDEPVGKSPVESHSNEQLKPRYTVPPSSYLGAMRSVIRRPQSLTLELRY